MRRPELRKSRRKADVVTTTRAPYSAERDQSLIRILRAAGRVTVSESAQELGVSTETIRKDLVRLERQGFLRRVHGGAVPIGSVVEPDVATRTDYALEKDRIARAAVAHLPQAGSVLIDAGSTTERMVDYFPADRALKVFTNALPTALRLMALPHLDVFLIGGRLRNRTSAAVGSWSTRMLSEIHVDVAFLGANGISFQRGLTTPDPDEADVKRLIIAGSSRRVLISDHSKLDLVSMVKFGDLRDVDLLITDSGLRPDDLRAFAGAGVDVEQV